MLRGRDGSGCPPDWDTEESMTMSRGSPVASYLRDLEEIPNESRRSRELRVLTDNKFKGKAVEENKSVGEEKLRSTDNDPQKDKLVRGGQAKEKEDWKRDMSKACVYPPYSEVGQF